MKINPPKTFILHQFLWLKTELEKLAPIFVFFLIFAHHKKLK